jgi:hypothetical protein
MGNGQVQKYSVIFIFYHVSLEFKCWIFLVFVSHVDKQYVCAIGYFSFPWVMWTSNICPLRDISRFSE